MARVGRSGWDARVRQVAGVGQDTSAAGQHGENEEQGTASFPTRAGMGRTALAAKDSAQARKKGE
jgi:hypothetical protein